MLGVDFFCVVVGAGMQGQPIKVRVTFVNGKNKGVVVHDSLDKVGVVEFTVFVCDDEWDVQ